MKKSILIVSLSALLFAGCKNDKTKENQAETNETEQIQETENAKENDDGTKVLIGDFIYTDDAAVINGKNFIYGVVIDSMAQTLIEKVEPFKEDEYDMVSVAVKGKVIPNPKPDGWEEVVEITKIINISKSKSNNEAIEINSGQKSL